MGQGQIVTDIDTRSAELVASVADQGTKYVLLSASGSDIANYTRIKGLRVYNTTDGAGLTVLGASEATADTPYEINFVAGNHIEPLRVRRVTVIDAGITVHAIF